MFAIDHGHCELCLRAKFVVWQTCSRERLQCGDNYLRHLLAIPREHGDMCSHETNTVEKGVCEKLLDPATCVFAKLCCNACLKSGSISDKLNMLHGVVISLSMLRSVCVRDTRRVAEYNCKDAVLLQNVSARNSKHCEMCCE